MPLRIYADGRDRRRREAAATALRMVSKMPWQTMHDQHLSVATRGTATKTPSSVRGWALKSEFSWCPTKGGVGIRRTKGDAPACPSGGIVKVVVSPAEGQ